MTGFGNGAFFLKAGDYSAGRVARMLFRLNALVVLACLVLDVPWMWFYICPMHSFFFLATYALFAVRPDMNASHEGMHKKFAIAGVAAFVLWDVPWVFQLVWRPLYFVLRFPGQDDLHEWEFRTGLDHYMWLLGALCAYHYTWLDKWLRGAPGRLRAALVGGTSVVFALWWRFLLVAKDKFEYNALHPYFSWIPLGWFIIVRNLTPTARRWYIAPLGEVGKITLETYILQYNVWLSASAKKTLLYLPARYAMLNFGLVSILFYFVSLWVFEATASLQTLLFGPVKQPAPWATVGKRLGAAIGLFLLAWALCFPIFR